MNKCGEKILNLCNNHLLNGRKWFIILLGLFIVSVAGEKAYGEVSEQFVRKNFHNISLEQGLSNITVISIIEDSNGYMWFGTRNGLNRFNGYEIEVFRNENNDSTTICNNHIYSILESKDQKIWVGTDNGLSCYHPKTGTFTSFFNNSNPNSLSGNTVNAIVEDKTGVLWVGSQFGINRYNQETKDFKRYNLDLPEPVVYNILPDHRDNLWLGTANGIAYFNKKNEQLSYVTEFTTKSGKAQSIGRVNSLFLDRKGHLWIGTQENGVLVYNIQKQRFKQYEHKSGSPNSISHNRIRSIIPLENGDIWIATFKGINLFDRKTKSFHRIAGRITETDDMKDLSIYPIFKDSKGSIWIGSYFNGVILYDPILDNFRTFSQEKHNNKSLSYNVISSFVEDPSGNVWVGTEGGGFCYFDRKTEEFTAYMHNENSRNSLSQNSVQALHLDGNNRLWIGTYIGGLNIYDVKRKSFKRYEFDPENENSIGNNYVSCFCEDAKGKIWVGTEGGGLNKYQPNTDDFKRITSINTPGFKYTKYINVIFEDSNNDLWLGTWDGLIHYNPETGDYKHFYSDRNNPQSISFNYINSILEDNEGFLWIGTRQGLNRFDRSSGTFKRYEEKDGLPNGNIAGILEDGKGNIWFGSHKGISVLNPFSNEIKNFDYTDGLQSNQFNKFAALKTISGEFFFGGVRGFNIFNPTEIIENTNVPEIKVTGFMVSNKKVEVGEKGSPLKNNIDDTEEIVLEHSQNDFSFDFVALNYIHSGKNKFECILENYDTEWISLGSRRTAVYTNINPGTYTFKVKASNNDGLWNEVPRTIKLTIKPPFWKTPWAYGLYFVTLYMLLLGLMRFNRYRKGLIEDAEKERREKERERDINQLKLSFFTNISHEFRTPLTLIQGPVERLLDDSASLDKVERKKLLQMVNKNSRRLLYLLNQLVDFRKIERGVLKLSVNEGNLNQMVQQVKDYFDHIANERNMDYQLKNSIGADPVWYDHDKLEKILFNLLSNAFKYTPDGGEVHVNTSSEVIDGKNHAILEVINTGKGIPKEELPRIFDRFYRAEKANHSGLFGSGIGLALTKSIVELHKGTITVESEVNVFTRFKVILPVEKELYSEEEIQQANLRDAADERIDEMMVVENEEIKRDDDDEKQEALPKLLIVEDTQDVRAFIRDILKQDYIIEVAGNGKEALAKMEEDLPDLILSDIMMPEMDGIEFSRTVKNDFRTSHIPIILLTAKTAEETQIESFEIRVDDYIKKPFNPRILQLKVRNILEARRKQKENYSKGIILQPNEVQLEDPDEKFLKRAMEVIEEHMADPGFKVNDFVAEVGLGRTVCYEKIKALTNLSVNEFIQGMRMKRAASLLKQNKLNVSEIAFLVGFNDPNYFSKCFKKYHGLKPSDFVKEG